MALLTWTASSNWTAGEQDCHHVVLLESVFSLSPSVNKLLGCPHQGAVRFALILFVFPAYIFLSGPVTFPQDPCEPVNCSLGPLRYRGWEPGVKCELVHRRWATPWTVSVCSLSFLFGFLLSAFSLPLQMVPVMDVPSIFSCSHSLLFSESVWISEW